MPSVLFCSVLFCSCVLCKGVSFYEALATETMFESFPSICTPSKNPKPQSGAKINLSASIHCKADSTLVWISCTDSILDLATFTAPKIRDEFLNNGSNDSRSF